MCISVLIIGSREVEVGEVRVLVDEEFIIAVYSAVEVL